MAIQNISDLLTIDTNWEGKTGLQVEDFISRHIPTSINYSDETLLLLNNNGDVIAEGMVTVLTPTYKLGVLILGIRVNGKLCDTNTLITLYNSNTKIELAIAAYSIILYSDKISDNKAAVKTTITFGTLKKTITVAPIEYQYCKDDLSGQLASITLSQSDWSWYDITDLFKVTLTSLKITAEVTDASSTLNISITNQVISLKYSNPYMVSNNLVSFTLVGGTSTNYHLEGFNGTTKIKTDSGKMNFTSLLPGLNLLSIKAVNNTDTNISTDYIYVNIIYTQGFTGSAVAINGINDNISNNDTATIYLLDVYSSDKDEVTISTYLEDAPPDDTNPKPTLLLESLSLTALDYTDNSYSTKYSKYIEINSDDAYKYLAVKVNDSWYSFYTIYNDLALNSASQSLKVSAVNTEFVYTASPSLNYDLIVGRNTSLFTDNRWVTSDLRTVYRVEANSNKVFDTPLELSLGTYYSLEFGLKTYNVSDESKPIITIGNLLIRPTTICWNTDNIELYNARNSQFLEGVDTHIMITVYPKYRIEASDPYYPNYLYEYLTAFDNYTGTVNLIRIFINSVIDREIVISDDELKSLQSATLLINPTTADLDLYLLRVYNDKALDFDEVKHNYISFLKKYSEKELFYNNNDIIGDDGTISFLKTLGKYNSLVYVFPKGGRFPNRSWAGLDNTTGALDSAAKKLPVTLFINYKDTNTNLTYGGRITNGLVKGLGSSAMRYLIWNTAYLLNKVKGSDGSTLKSVFTPYSNLVTETNKFKEDPTDTKEGYYVMPPYDGLNDDTSETIKIKKLVGKVNFASSMQSHKEGACKLFNDAYKNGVAKNLISGGRKAVQEETFLYFYIETDLDSVLDMELADVLARDDIKFMGVQTWGSAKGDNATFGYDSKITPEHILIEGGENTDPHVQFRRPWQALLRGTGTLGEVSYKLGNQPTVTSVQSKEEPWLNLWIIDESITYDGNRGAWDLDYGVEEVTTESGNTYYLIMESAKPSFKKFREFVDFVYTYDYDLVTVADANPDTTTWDLTKKYVVTSPSSFSGFPSHKAGDIYRYDDINKEWVAAGTEYNNGWSRLNLYEISGDTSQKPVNAIAALKTKFSEGIAEYIDINDIAFHQAFIRLLSGTDNRAKNTYFQIIGKIYAPNSEGTYEATDKGDYKVRLMGDDLDTIIITDNNGLLSKPYNLLEPSYEPSTADLWGDNGLNKFFYMFDLMYEDRIKELLLKIILYAYALDTQQSTTSNYFYKVFYSILKEKIPAVAYNHFAKIYYEAALLVLNSKAMSYYGNNGVQPIEQSHGACIEGEMHFMKKRYNFLASYAQTNMGNVGLETTSSAGSGDTLTLRIAFTPFLDFYPNYLFNNNTYKYYAEFNKDSAYNIIKYKVEADKDYVVEIKESGTAINQGLLMLSCFKKLDITGLKMSLFNATFDRVIDFTIDNANIDKYPSLFGSSFPKLSISNYTASFPVVEELNLKNISLPDTLDLSTYDKLKTLNLSNSTVKRVILPSNVLDITLPETIETFELYNPVTSVIFEGLANLKTVDLDNVGDFNITEFCNNIIDSTLLKSVTLRHLNHKISAKALSKLLSVNAKLSGVITVVDDNGDTTSIDYATKADLISNYGNIDSADNSLYVKYTTKLATSISCEKNISIYGSYLANPFNVSINGNNVAITKDDDGNYVPDITYTLSGATNIATIDKRSGVITLLKDDDTTTGKASITVKLTNGQTLSVTDISISFSWKAPKLGDFVYADGTYSNAYNSNKTLMGLVYAVAADADSNSGTAYVLGKEYVGDAKGYYVGYSDEGTSGTNTPKDDLGKVLTCITELLSSELTSYHTVEDSRADVEDGTLTITKDSTIYLPSTFNGASVTESYINHVNENILQYLHGNTDYERYISSNNGKYYIASINDLNSILKLLPNLSSQNPNVEFMQCLVFPYFYITHLYSPEVKDSEKETDAYKLYFSAGNWYIPSLKELANLIYYRGYSAKASLFTAGGDVVESINTANTGNAIFSTALKSMGNHFPSVWTNIADSNNLASTTADGIHHHSYQATSTWSGVTTYKWVTGFYNTTSYYDSANINAWRLTKHRPLPCTKFEYSKLS